MFEKAILVKHLKKIYHSNKVEAVKDVSFDVEQGEIFGFLGPNGAGKSTTIKTLIGLLNPTQGEIYINGLDALKNRNEVRMMIGYSSQALSLDDKLTAYENIYLQGEFYHLKREEILKRSQDILTMFELWGKRNDLVESFSGGMMKRLDLAEALIHQPKILFLDEPTLGLDIQTRHTIWEYIRKLRSEYQMTIFLTTHYLEEADELCDRVAIIDHGQILVIDKPSVLKSQIGGDIITMVFQNSQSEIQSFLKKIESLKQIKSISSLPEGVYQITVKTKGDELIPQLFHQAEKNKIKIESVRLKRPTLDDVYLSYTGETIRDTEGSAEGAREQRMNMAKLRR
ncbi:MAG: ATP-binding cassette domain-containing protein [Minisyncoccia bacterium]